MPPRSQIGDIPAYRMAARSSVPPDGNALPPALVRSCAKIFRSGCENCLRDAIEALKLTRVMAASTVPAEVRKSFATMSLALCP
jgi:hypothetical protein